MAENKTKASIVSVATFLNAIEDKRKRSDAKVPEKLIAESVKLMCKRYKVR